MERKRKFLCGKWKYRINGGSEETRNVPFSAFCTGESECYTEFDSEIFDVKTQSVLLVFEGITYKAEVLVNGKLIGEMLPYCRYVFDVGNILKLGSNKVLVKLYDMGVVFGPSEGWENYGGIIRDVYLEYVSKARIKNFFWKTDLSKNYNSSGCSIRVELDIPSKDSAAYSIQAILRNRGAVVSSARTDLKQAKAVVNFYVDNPALWSPDAPNLYDLEVNLLLKDTVIDAVSGAVGFKELKAKGGKFYLNGEALFLRGVCRHDMWGHSGGHTLTDAQMEQDMQMIKRTGFNFVRLVHYPHNKRIVEIADRIGLLVSEEPGLWWSDLKNKEVTDAALEVLRSTIIRDRSNVSVAFWLAFNECELTAEFAAMAASVAHKNDPTRLVSGANCMNTADTKRLFTEQGFDFYTYHPYGPNPNNVSTGIGGAKEPASMAMIMKELDDKPLVFTEWGGWYPIGNHNLMNEFLDTLINAGKSNEKGKGLAGMAYWQWNDIYEANRGPPACIDGILIEGLVDVDRHPKEDLAVFSAKLAESFYEKEKTPDIEISGLHKVSGNCKILDIWKGINLREADKNFRSAIEDSIPVKGFHHKVNRRLPHGPVLQKDIFNLGGLPVDIRKGSPITITKNNGPVVFDAHIGASRLYFIGQAGFGDLYPLGKRDSRVIAEYIVVYDDGGEFVIPIRNGIEITTILGSYGPSRIDPRAGGVSRVIKICYDLNWEVFYINLLEVELPKHGKIGSIKIKVNEEGITLLLYGITVV